MAPFQRRRQRRNKSIPTIMDPICHKCDKVITKRMVTAMGKTWHPEHFACKDCNEPISEAKCHVQEGEPVCKQCFLKNYAVKCHGCKQPILDRKIKSFGQPWHEDCFVCTGPCKKSLVGTCFLERDGKGYCKTDFMELFAERCVSCGRPLSEDTVVAINGKWHRECFKCTKCSQPITITTYSVEDNDPICVKCTWKEDRAKPNE